MLKKLILHPFAFALYFVLALLANNIDRVRLSDTYRTGVVVLLVTAAVFGLFWLLTRSAQRAGLVCSIFVMLFSSLGHVYNLLKEQELLGMQLGQADLIVALYLGSFIFWGWFFWRALKRPEVLTHLLNIIALILICAPLLQIVFFYAQELLTRPAGKVEAVQGTAVVPSGSNQPPDIYYIILDEYTSSAMMAEIMDYDNSPFVRALEERGFYVAEESRSNYIITHLSLASSLNWRYLDGLIPPKESDHLSTVDMIRHSQARSFLAERGYRYISFATGWLFSDTPDADQFIRSEQYMNDFEATYLLGTALLMNESAIVSPRHRNVIRTIFGTLGQLPEMAVDRPKFVFAHTPGVHVPYVFGPNGEEVTPWFFDSYAEMARGRTYSVAYTDQVGYINTLVLDAIDEILAKSAQKPIIIIQGDHGAQGYLDWNSMENTCHKLRTSIFNAYYFPDQNYEQLYPTISPVNTFRVIFNQYFDAGYGLVEDRSYYSYWEKPYEYHDVTGVDGKCPTGGE